MILKVCGITCQEDADAAVEYGANAIGFNFYPKSPRYIDPELAARIETPAGVLRVGVFVGKTGQIARLDVVQIHGNTETAAESPGNLPVWLAVQVKETLELPDVPADAFLLDGPAGELYGGSGKTFDWSLVRNAGRRIIVAGGLDGSNVARAVEIARPWGVDACSRIERAPGKKDHQKMKEYLSAARTALAS
jgi:phosphoribosylanthranilate isomerase